MIIGFVGLGTMGQPMAANLLRAGYELIVYNRNRRKAEGLGLGVTIADSPGDAVRRSDVVITMLSDDHAIKEVYHGAEGIIPALQQYGGARIVMDCSTISPRTSIELAQKLDGLGVVMLDAPVTGSEPQAIEGILTFIVGGKKEIFEQCRPIFEAMGKKAIYMGESGSGSKTKLANNALVAANLIALSESLALVSTCGLDPALFLEVVAGGGARSGMAEMKGPKILNRDFSPQFMTQLMLKDLKLASQLADSMQLPMPALGVAKQIFQIACNEGMGSEDMSAVARCYEQWAQRDQSAKS
jgi:3-hydroxyisobutyrate dehydrogenase